MASRIDATDALEAVDGWSGDRYVGFTRDDTDCVRVAVRNDSRHDAGRLADALGAWTDALPGDASEASATGRLVTFTACEPPSATVPSYDMLDDAVTLLFRRDDLELYLMAQGAPALGARCLASRAAAEPVIDAWYQADVDDQDATDAADARLAELAPDCDLGVTR